jgi:hypothetical protein
MLVHESIALVLPVGRSVDSEHTRTERCADVGEIRTYALQPLGPPSAATTNLCDVLSARDAARGVLVLAEPEQVTSKT